MIAIVRVDDLDSDLLNSLVLTFAGEAEPRQPRHMHSLVTSSVAEKRLLDADSFEADRVFWALS